MDNDLRNMWKLFFDILEKDPKTENTVKNSPAEEKQSSSFIGDLIQKSSSFFESNESKTVCNQKKYPTEDYYLAFWNLCGKMHPDVIMNKFLKARKDNVNNAVEMLIKNLNWRY